VPAGIVRTVLEALADVDASPLTGVAPNAPGTVRLPPPMLDEHGRLVREHGWEAFRHLTPIAAR
jgi:glutaryl-CoA transferase